MSAVGYGTGPALLAARLALLYTEDEEFTISHVAANGFCDRFFVLGQHRGRRDDLQDPSALEQGQRVTCGLIGTDGVGSLADRMKAHELV